MALKGMKIAAVVLSFAVFAIVTGCNGGYYSVTGGSGTLSAPTGLTAAAGNAQVALSWTAPSSGLTPGSTTPESYNLYYSTSTGVTTASGTKISGITPTTYTQTGLTNGTTYYYVVTAVYSSGESAASSQASATPSSGTVATLTVTTTSVANGTDGSAYSATLAATGGTAPYTWSVTAGSLPAGLTLGASTGIISGTATQSGTQSFTVQVRDSEGTPQTASENLSITIASGLAISTASLPSGTVGAAYTTTLAATGGTAPYSWSVTGGSLPSGLTLAAGTGIVSGTPTAAGTSNFTVQAADSEGTPATVTASLSLVVNAAALSITTTTLPAGTVNAAYTTTLAASGGTAPYTWSVTSGSLPAGLTLAGSTGIISGTPTSAGTANITVQAKDSETTPVTASANLSITINPAALTITTSSLIGGTVGAAYTATLAATGGTTPYTWSVTSGSLPLGLSLAGSTGIISGTPSQSGTESVTIQVKDSEATPKTATANLSIAVNSGLTVTTTSLTAGTVGATYNVTLAATGGAPPYTWSVTSGSLPLGLSLAGSTGIISGTPSAAGTSNFTVQVKDSEGTPATATANLSIIVNAAGISITSASLPSGTVSSAYTTTLAATGGAAPYTWSVTSGSLPAGLTLAGGSGIISGTPSQSGAQSFTVQVKDSEVTPKTASTNLSITISSGLAITTSTLPAGTVSVTYTTTLSATGGIAPYTWSVTSGTLPAGLTLASGTGILSGTPTAAGTSVFTVQAKDSEGTPAAATANLSITINPAALVITTAALPIGALNTSYTATLAATGGTAPYTWSITSGSLPAGLTLAPATGVISGTPTATGTSSFTVEVKDSESTPATATAKLSIIVNTSGLAITTNALPSGTVGSAYTTTLSASGGTTPYTWTITSGSLPAGLMLAAGTGVISGTPTQTETSTFTVQVKDSESTPETASTQLSIIVYSGLAIETRSLTNGLITNSYAASLQAEGGTSPYTWTLIAGSLPPGLTLASTGAISGTATTQGNYVFQAQLKDSEPTPTTLTANFLISVLASTPLSITRQENIETVGTAFNVTLQTNNTAGTVTGTAPYTWSIASGTLPAGITLSSTGLVSGTPTTAGVSYLSVKVTDADNNTAIGPYTLEIIPSTLAFDNTTLPNGNVGLVYNGSDAVQISGGASGTGYTASITSGSLPPGLSMSTKGLITGTPTTAGAYPITIMVTDAASNTVSQAFTLNVYQDAPCPTGSESELSGTYTFAVHGFSGYGLGYPEAAVISFTANGSGGITSAEGDVNISTAGGSQLLTFTAASTYSVGANGLGCLSLVTANGTGNIAVAFSLNGLVSGVATKGKIINFDARAFGADELTIFGPPTHNVSLFTGGLLRQTPADFTLATLATDLAFGLSGNDASIGHFGMVGSLNNSASGTFSDVFADWNDSGSLQSNLSGGSGGFTGTPDAHGRVLASMTIGGRTFNYVAYIVNADAILLVSSDAISVNPIVSGLMLVSYTTVSNSDFSGNYIYGASGSDASNGGNGFWTTGVVTLDSTNQSFSGTEFRYEYDCPCGNAGGSAAPISGTYALNAASRRVSYAVSGGESGPVVYLSLPATGILGFLLDTTTGSGATAYEGEVLDQPAGTYSNSSLSGSFTISSGDQATNFEDTVVGTASFSNGTGTEVEDTSEPAASGGGVGGIGLYSIQADGTGRLGDNDSTTILVTNGTTVYGIDYSQQSSPYLVFVH